MENTKAKTHSKCRSCKAELKVTFADLGMSPISNAFLHADQLQTMEPFYPLKAYVCESCFLVQLEEFETRENIFNSNYAYFSSYSDLWLKHSQAYSVKMIDKLKLSSTSLVVEVASNDGYLLQYFKESGIPVLGVEPSGNVAESAIKKGIPTLVEFMGQSLGERLSIEGKKADLIAGNNVVAHVPDINDFVKGLMLTLKDTGVITLEFPHLEKLIKFNQFDTIYHEHFSYLSLHSLQVVFERNGLRIFDVDELTTHGGSLRIYACHQGNKNFATTSNVLQLQQREKDFGITNISMYQSFQKNIEITKRKALQFLIQAKEAGKTVVGYGAPAKGNTLLNYCGVRQDFIDYTVDRSTHKQGMFLPGVHIPILSPEKIYETKPDYVFILPWNLKEEIEIQMKEIRSWGGKFVVAIPALEVF